MSNKSSFFGLKASRENIERDEYQTSEQRSGVDKERFGELCSFLQKRNSTGSIFKSPTKKAKASLKYLPSLSQ